MIAAELLDDVPSATGRTVPRWAYPAGFTVILTAGAVLRFWALATKPGWQFDEGVYTLVASNLLMHGQIAEHITYGSPWSPDLYQPPFYFILLARWFALVSPSIYHARIFGVLCSLVTLTMFWRLLTRLHGDHVALLVMIPVVFDGWLLYVQRVSYMENMLLMLITCGMFLYQRALDGRAAPIPVSGRKYPFRHGAPVMMDGRNHAKIITASRRRAPSAVATTSRSWVRFVAAGTVLGFAIVFKYTGVYILAAVLLAWLIRRRDHREHLILLIAAVVTAAGFLLFEIKFYDTPGHDWWMQETIVQVRRVLGIQSSGGTLTSPAKGFHLLLAQYKVFAPSFIIAVVATVIGVRRLWACYRARDWAPARPNSLLFAWMIAGLVIFGSSSLRYPQYFALILLPMYGFFWTEAYRWQWGRRRPLIALAAVACLLGVLSFWGRVGVHGDNVFADVQAYAARSIPPTAVVVADEAVGDLISQPYCREQKADPCVGGAAYAITWDTYLQTSWQLGDSAFHQMMVGAVEIKSWTGFNGTVAVWKLRR